MIQGRQSAELSRAANAGAINTAAHEGKSADEEAEHAQGVHHEIHRHGVRCVLGASQPGINKGETGLHEHD